MTDSIQNVIMYMGDFMDFFDYDFNVIKIIFACLVPSGTGDAVHNCRPSHGIALNLDGEKEYIFDNNEKLTARENDIIFLPEKSNYTVTNKSYGDCYAINFKIDEQVLFRPFVLHIKNSAKLLDSFKAAEKAFKVKQTGYMMKCKAELYSVIYLIMLENGFGYVSGGAKKIVEPALEYIHNTYAENSISIKYLSALCNVSEVYFRKLFVKCTGIPPINYINGLKLLRAKELLAQSQCSLETVAEMSGFGNLCYFCRYFKKETGITPSEYRKNVFGA